MSDRHLELLELFTRLTESAFIITSEQTSDYNCVGWALKREDAFYDHVEDGGEWPPELQRPEEGLIEDYIRLFEHFNFIQCPDGEGETGYVKIALYEKRSKFSHVARLLPNGKWASKLGHIEDIEHLSLSDLENSTPYSKGYGKVTCFMKRPQVESDQNP